MLLPALDLDGVAVAAYELRAGFTDLYFVVVDYAEDARANGADIRTRTPVIDVYLDGPQPAGIETTDGIEPVDYVINPAGPSGGEIAAMVGVLRSEEPYEPERPTLSYISRAPDMYLKPKPSGNFLAGGIDQSPVDQSVGLRGVDESFLRAVGRRPKGRIPEYADTGVVDS